MSERITNANVAAVCTAVNRGDVTTLTVAHGNGHSTLVDGYISQRRGRYGRRGDIQHE